MKVSCLQMNMKLGCTEENFVHAKQLIRDAMKENPDVLVLPETWNTGFFPKENLVELSCKNGDEIKSCIGGLAKQYGVNIVAGSVSNVRDGKVFNTAMIFDRDGECIAEYDKTHLFTPMGEDDYYTGGDHLCRFTLDGVKCGIIICYDVRFPELTRSLALQGLDMLFVVSQWPKERIFHLQTLTVAPPRWRNTSTAAETASASLAAVLPESGPEPPSAPPGPSWPPLGPRKSDTRPAPPGWDSGASPSAAGPGPDSG